MPTQEQSASEQELDRIRLQVAGDAAVVLARLLERIDEWRTDEPETCPGSPEGEPARRVRRPSPTPRCRRRELDHGGAVSHGQL